MFYDYSLIDKVGLNCVFFGGEGEVSKSVSGGNHRTYLHNFAITCSTYSRSSVKCTEENPWSSSFMYITHCWMCNIFLLEDKPNISLMSLAGLRDGYPSFGNYLKAIVYLWSQTWTSPGTKISELCLGSCCISSACRGQRSWGHMSSSPASRGGDGSAVLRNPLVDLIVRN